MNNSKKLLGSLLAAIICISSSISAMAPASRQKIQKLELVKAQLAAINTSPILMSGVNPSETVQLKSMITEDIRNIKDDLKRIQNALKAIIDNEIESIKVTTK